MGIAALVSPRKNNLLESLLNQYEGSIDIPDKPQELENLPDYLIKEKMNNYVRNLDLKKLKLLHKWFPDVSPNERVIQREYVELYQIDSMSTTQMENAKELFSLFVIEPNEHDSPFNYKIHYRTKNLPVEIISEKELPFNRVSIKYKINKFVYSVGLHIITLDRLDEIKQSGNITVTQHNKFDLVGRENGFIISVY